MRESLLEILICGFVLACFTIDECCENVGLNYCSILLKTVIDLSECAWSIIEEPASLSEQHLSLSQACILFRDIFKKLDGFDEVLWGTSRGDLWLCTAMDEVLLGKLHEEISVELDIEI